MGNVWGNGRYYGLDGGCDYGWVVIWVLYEVMVVIMNGNGWEYGCENG